MGEAPRMAGQGEVSRLCVVLSGWINSICANPINSLARTMSKDFHHRDYRDKEREKESSYVSNRGSYAGNKHSRGSSRVRWHSDDPPPASHRRRHDGKLI